MKLERQSPSLDSMATGQGKTQVLPDAGEARWCPVEEHRLLL